MICAFMQAISLVPFQSLRTLKIDDMEGETWLPLLAGATNLLTLGIACGLGNTTGLLSAIHGLPSLRQVFHHSHLSYDRHSLFTLGQIDAKLKRQGAILSFPTMPI